MKKKVLILTIIAVALLIISNFIVNPLYNSNSQKIKEYNEPASLLKKKTFKTELTDLSPLTYPQRVIALFESVNAVTKTSDYKSKVEVIIFNFDAKIKTYSNNVNKFLEKDLVVDVSKYDFEQKTRPDAAIADLKVQVRNQIIQENIYNLEFIPEKELAYMTLEEKVGQVLGFGVPGTALTPDYSTFYKDHPFGTYILFGENINTSTQTINLTKSLKALNKKYPMLITADQEGGSVKRVYWDNTQALNRISLMNKSDQCKEWESRSKLLLLLGINWNLGIVADVSKDPKSFIYYRTFGNDYNLAADSTKNAVECHDVVFSTLKHWPGHGSTAVDTHKQIGTVTKDSENQWKEEDFKPFKVGLETGADSIMVGHLIIPWVDDKPASISKKSIDYLKQLSNTDKTLIVSDDMNMLTVSGYELDKASFEAFLAGNDIILISKTDQATQSKVFNYFVSQIKDNSEYQKLLDEKVVKILTKKMEFIEYKDKYIPSNLIY